MAAWLVHQGDNGRRVARLVRTYTPGQPGLSRRFYHLHDVQVSPWPGHGTETLVLAVLLRSFEEPFSKSLIMVFTLTDLYHLHDVQVSPWPGHGTETLVLAVLLRSFEEPFSKSLIMVFTLTDLYHLHDVQVSPWPGHGTETLVLAVLLRSFEEPFSKSLIMVFTLTDPRTNACVSALQSSRWPTASRERSRALTTYHTVSTKLAADEKMGYHRSKHDPLKNDGGPSHDPRDCPAKCYKFPPTC
ncbi:hypothetical protein RRG08_019651 [Elysia crispata]|uniref:Uncharacterized protein n=1 Tax=Elysia crispata TaxID=231223 RepID=A0AAE1E7I6_9GAST|nr:hypothetical protein RRG08_019651 [Elysia crispata]